jgi:hypothetical protein
MATMVALEPGSRVFSFWSSPRDLVTRDVVARGHGERLDPGRASSLSETGSASQLRELVVAPLALDALARELLLAGA